MVPLPTRSNCNRMRQLFVQNALFFSFRLSATFVCEKGIYYVYDCRVSVVSPYESPEKKNSSLVIPSFFLLCYFFLILCCFAHIKTYIVFLYFSLICQWFHCARMSRYSTSTRQSDLE
ncbi:hypothetical protein HD554DRAFT_607137 [Boletus coccyginus]|nr:hypothetical protein HD554DRAFT_607137 [Boletus coccyginus]